MIAFRFALIFIHLFAGLITCATLIPFTSAVTHEKLVRRWSRRLLAICRVDVHLQDLSSGQGADRALVISNHVSWLDIFVMNSHQPCHFVAKADIRSWPLIGWLCQMTGTIFIARGKPREVRRIYEGIVNDIASGKRIAFFPEGTTSAQGSLLAFHANLFEAAIEAKVPVQPYAVRYVDAAGNLNPAADFIGEMTFAESMKLILQSGGMRAELVRLPALNTEGEHRRDLAVAARASIARGLQIKV